MIAGLEQKLLKRRKQGNLRRLQVPPPLIDFSSNDYLGLSRSQTLEKMIQDECAQQLPHRKLGSTGSRLLTGNSAYIQLIEEQIARFHRFETGLLFNCGYMANLGLLSTIMNSEDIVYYDACIHASSRDGIRLSGAQAFPFRHNDLYHLEKRLKHATLAKNRFICIESIYSTDGSEAPLMDICQLAKTYDARVIVDEAHAVGVCGSFGKGLVGSQLEMPEIFAKVVTFGKALGVHGAIVLGSKILKQALINFAHAYIYTTALPFYSLAAIKCSYEHFPKLDFERNHLSKLIHLFRNMPLASKTPIQSIPIPGNSEAKNAAYILRAYGFDVRPLLSPTVQQGHEILRVSLHAFNSIEEVEGLLKLVETYVPRNNKAKEDFRTPNAPRHHESDSVAERLECESPLSLSLPEHGEEHD